MWKKTKRIILALATGAAAMAFTTSCDPRTGAFFIDRFDDDDYYFDGGFFDFGYWGDCCYGDVVVVDEYWW